MPVRSGAAPVFSDDEVTHIAARMLDLMKNPDQTDYESLLAVADQVSVAYDRLPDTATLGAVAALAADLLPFFPSVTGWTTAKQVTLVAGAARLRRYATNDRAEFQRFIISVRERAKSHDPNIQVHW